MEDSQNKEKDFLLPGSILVAAFLIAGALIYSVTADRTASLPTADLSASANSKDLADDDVILGDPKAPVTIVEFGDYQCPFCARFFKTIEPQIRENYINAGKAKMIYRDFAFLGPESAEAANAAQCAAESGKYWVYHDRLFETEILDGIENNGNLNTALFKSIAAEIGLDKAKFETCLNSGKYKAEIEKDYKDGLAAGVQGTPATFVGKQFISGAVDYSEFQSAIEAALNVR